MFLLLSLFLTLLWLSNAIILPKCTAKFTESVARTKLVKRIFRMILKTIAL